jgi:hypothetical protein
MAGGRVNARTLARSGANIGRAGRPHVVRAPLPPAADASPSSIPWV